MAAHKGRAVLGGGNLYQYFKNSSTPEWNFARGSAELRHRERNIYKINYTHDSADYGVEWYSNNLGWWGTTAANNPDSNKNSPPERPYANLRQHFSGWGMVIRMTDINNYYAAYYFNHRYGADLTKNGDDTAGQGLYVDKVVSGVTTNLLHVEGDLNVENTGAPYSTQFWAVGDTLYCTSNFGSTNWSTTDTSLSSIGNPGFFFMNWNLAPALLLLDRT